MDKQLSKKQIEALFTFVRSKYVRYIDLQYELVDHLASAIEDEIQQHEHLSFDSALSRIYSRFPITGFSRFVAEKERAMTAYWRNRYFKSALSYFTPPRIFLTILFCIVSFQVIQVWGMKGVGILLVVSLVSKIFCSFMIVKKMRALKKKQADYLFLQSSSILISAPFSFDYFLFIWLKDAGQSPLDTFQTTISIALATFSLIVTHQALTIFPQMIHDEMVNKYKHLGFT
jgi:hypothetical protein